MEEIQLDRDNEADAEILSYTSPAVASRRKAIVFGACIVLTLFILANMAISRLLQ